MVRALFLSFMLLWSSLVLAQDWKVGDAAVFRAEHALGVPLHREPRPSLVGRALDGSEAKIVAIQPNSRWVQVETPGGLQAWVLARYLAAQTTPNPGPSTRESAAATSAVWTSPDECRSRVANGERLVKSDDRIRIATWNIRWFPWTSPEREGINTDLDWLSCVLAWMQADVIAVQEILDTRDADFAWATLFDGLKAHMGGNWRVDLQECGDESAQHVGFVWNADRITLSNTRDVWQLNGASMSSDNPCADNLRPGRGAYAKSLSGGADFHIVVAHADSGTKERDFEHRQTALHRLDSVFADLNSQASDADIILLGDLNTMGAQGRADAEGELQLLGQVTSKEAPEYRHLKLTPACTEYFEGVCGWLDHVLVGRTMAEAERTELRLTGYCAESGGAPIRGSMPAAYERLSDHCPVVLDLADQDLD
ncbi:endonuclease/exonuclease/phosphatase family protein [Microvirga pakistanensis]|uniref:endonuclease/exonuclease/phosphatase family protein n=1 Tax=Microvirga pakistanensis TaxID=1682650 RepID=UPI00106AE168|nr:endonuclease/exonuclease/phosphatase family protein [Microvirga pakistanensis]